jgi:hypothetical protein
MHCLYTIHAHIITGWISKALLTITPHTTWPRCTFTWSKDLSCLCTCLDVPIQFKITTLHGLDATSHGPKIHHGKCTRPDMYIQFKITKPHTHNTTYHLILNGPRCSSKCPKIIHCLYTIQTHIVTGCITKTLHTTPYNNTPILICEQDFLHIL